MGILSSLIGGDPRPASAAQIADAMRAEVRRCDAFLARPLPAGERAIWQRQRESALRLMHAVAPSQGTLL